MSPVLSRTLAFGVAFAAFAVVWAGVQSTLPVDQASGSAFVGEAHAAEKATIIPMPRVDAAETGKRAVAIFAGGCFWGVEGVFEHTKGVISASSGYHGGTKRSASYQLVSAGITDHAEAVRVVYDPQQISYGKLMQIFFSVVADPTMLNAQGPDRGKHYRSALVPVNAGQAKAAKAYIAQLEKGGYWSRPIVTRVEAYKAFYPAESYHQNFMQNNPRQGYIVRWDKPKVANLKQHFPAQYRAKPVT
ncbi:MAG: peptide-methionine (S)-S-oxide reductase MsrA [Sphingomonadales bacterium]|nr:peptide-methionine (S)-S-oxide reductase MsrA [Sphingomonadales bacterium]PIX67498.1 MAG: peptide-methionine (S)-S-oxide reductase [Sphingomonadales bacterium CG_4_10_14_3_um_filter_58_15]NCO49592.1 peptide-methionine (S)-S-oxide reductase MsrA [Sphingomonadales bacterium]NCP00292.1 peptide-methionine (S)-S-oxide reductase MsrA [Sphingomonadales bacterium]NCP25693.1 peptide-methionine (S)-S-oxide reductase MsrA [Sphingomonadales bacterium]